MIYDIHNIYRSACLVTEFEEAGQTIRLWGDRTHLWLDPVLEEWQVVVILLNAMVHKSLVNGPPAETMEVYSDGEGVICDREKIEVILQEIIEHPDSCDAVALQSCAVSMGDRQRWVKRLDWNEDSERGDGPLHFFHCTEKDADKCPENGIVTGRIGSDKSGIIIPIEAIDEWLREWDNSYFYWSGDRRKIEPWLESGKRALQQLSQPIDPKTLGECEAWARQIDRLDPKQEDTHEQWNQLHRSLALHGIFDPEDGGVLGEQLVNHGYITLARYREAAIALYAHAEVIPGLFFPDCDHPLAATVSLQWFRLGPFHNAQQDVIKYLNYGLSTFIGSKSRNVSSCIISSCSGGGSGTFWYAKGIAHSQLYAGGHTVTANEFDGYRLSVVSAQLSRAGHTVVARAIAAFAVLQEPEQFQHWVELGMTLWYDGRTSEGMTCLAYAAEIDRGFAATSFFQDKQAEETERRLAIGDASQSLPPNPGDHYLNEALTDPLTFWSSLPSECWFMLVWLRSLFTEPRFDAHWFALMDRVGDTYLSREIFRGLTPEAREQYLLGRSHSLCQRLQAHVWPIVTE